MIAKVRSIAFAIAAALVPAVLVGLLLVGFDYWNRELTRLERDSIAITRALSAAVDAELAVTQAALTVLATSVHLRRDDLAAFHVQASEVSRRLGFTNIIVTDRTGRQLLNTFRAFGEPLPTQGDPGGLLRAFDTRAPVISDLFKGRITKDSIIGVGVPVIRDGKVVYGLNAGVSPGHLSALLARQQLPEGWIAGVVDRQGTIVARTHDAARLVGQKASPALAQRVQDQTVEGVFQSETVEGIPVLTVFRRSANSGWSVAIGIPMRELDRHLASSLIRLFIIGFTTLSIALALGLLMARRLSKRQGS